MEPNYLFVGKNAFNVDFGSGFGYLRFDTWDWKC